MCYIGFELVADAEVVIDDDLAQVVDATRQWIEPSARAGSFICRVCVVPQEAVEIFYAGFLVEIGGKQDLVLRLSTAVAGPVEVPAFFGSDQSEVFAPGFSALAHAVGASRLDFVRGADAAVALLNVDGETGRVLHYRFDVAEHQIVDAGTGKIRAAADAIVDQARLLAKDVDAMLLVADARY